jgi:hypothetical protein
MTNQYILNKARETIAKVSLTEEGEEYKQREYFSKLLPQVMQLRSEGISFQKIAALLEKGGLKLSPSTVRQYYSEFNFQRMQDLVMEMDDHINKLRVPQN